jgi:hypothetical protein
VLTYEGGAVRSVEADEWPAAIERGSQATNEIYFTIVGWPDRFRVEYGALLFANHTKSFLDLAGIDAAARLRDAAQATVDGYLEHLLAGPDVPAAMVHWGTTEGPLFWPVA